MEQRPDLLAHGPIAAVYGILDRVVDAYGPVIEELDTDIREVEIEVFSPDRANPARGSTVSIGRCSSSTRQ